MHNTIKEVNMITRGKLMATLIDDKLRFFAKYNIKEKEFNQSGLQWDSLIEIYNHYLKQKPLLENTGKTIADILRTEPAAHTVRMRIKDPEHLIEKLIRKKIKDNDFSFSIDDYMEKITDLIGLRVLHLYKSEARKIDEMIREQWELAETVTIYFREGDMDDKAQEILRREGEFKPEKHKYGYRSWHYLIKSRLTKVQLIAEIQVRTIFEEGWSEIDHKLRYPYNRGDQVLTNQLLVLNRLAGSADEMVDSIIETLARFDEMKKDKKNMENELNELRSDLEKAGLENDKLQSILDKVDKIDKSQDNLFSIRLSNIDESLRSIGSLGESFSSSIGSIGDSLISIGSVGGSRSEVRGIGNSLNIDENITETLITKKQN